MPWNIRYPNIRGANPNERTEEIRKYLYYLADTLNMSQSQDQTSNTAEQEQDTDYIVSQRKVDNFFIRKWNSGVMEAFGTITFERMTLNVSGNYYSADVSSKRIKCGMRKVYNLQASASCDTDADVFVTQAKFENEELTCRICSNVKEIENVQIRIHIIGRK